VSSAPMSPTRLDCRNNQDAVHQPHRQYSAARRAVAHCGQHDKPLLRREEPNDQPLKAARHPNTTGLKVVGQSDHQNRAAAVRTKAKEAAPAPGNRLEKSAVKVLRPHVSGLPYVAFR
jgi:hypothetical protein